MCLVLEHHLHLFKPILLVALTPRRQKTNWSIKICAIYKTLKVYNLTKSIINIIVLFSNRHLLHRTK